jgi:hypothetical protein
MIKAVEDVLGTILVEFMRAPMATALRRSGRVSSRRPILPSFVKKSVSQDPAMALPQRGEWCGMVVLIEIHRDARRLIVG